MKAISTGTVYSIYDDTLKTYDSLPTQVYSVRFSKMQGFFLERHSDIKINEEKIYGVHISKVEKVLSAFSDFKRNLGVILSGDKGIGKSLFAKLLSIRAIEHELPVIIIDEYIPGIASFIESIEQEAMFLFDEFDKTFANDIMDDGISPQAAMLTLFDGLSQGKKLFVITCNEIRMLSDYLINRPGRFHYHFRFEYPSPSEVREYLEDKLDEKYYDGIDEVIAFSKKVDLNYDCLRAIAFEMNRGEKFSTAIKDLNIINIKSEVYNLTLYYDNGLQLYTRNISLDLFNDSDEDETHWFKTTDGDYIVRVTFNTTDCIFDAQHLSQIIPGDCIHVSYDDDEDDSSKVKTIIQKAKDANVLYMTINRKRSKDIHYTV